MSATKFGSNQIASLGITRAEKFIPLGSLHWDHAQHWCAIKLRAGIIGRFTCWRDDDLLNIKEFAWPYVKGSILSWGGHGKSHSDIGFIYSEPLADGRVIYSGEFWATPCSKFISNEHGVHWYCPVILEDDLPGEEKQYDEFFGEDL